MDSTAGEAADPGLLDPPESIGFWDVQTLAARGFNPNPTENDRLLTRAAL